jgi:hypothetical protein
MDNASPISTCDALIDLGFQPDADVISDEGPGLSFDFGNFRLSASSILDLRFRPVVLFSGVLTTERTIAEVDFSMLRTVQSRELCAAWIVWHLDQAAGNGTFQPSRPVEWINEGRRFRSILPWVIADAEYEREMAEYAACPQCRVSREWLKLALKQLADHLAGADDADPVEFVFDGEKLLIRCAKNIVVMPADGKAWESKYTIPAGKLRGLPKRLTSETICLSVWRRSLTIDRTVYHGIMPATVCD